MDVMATAQGIISVVIANMARAIRVISVQRGHDPRDYTLVAFGGAGPLHAARLARELEMRRILVPLTPGIMCATGLLQTDLRADFASTSLTILSADSIATLGDAFAGLEARAEGWFGAEAIPAADRVVERSVDVRYAGQNYEVSVAVPEGPIDDVAIAAIRARFEEEHRRLYGFIASEDPIQLVTFRVGATGLVAKAAFRAFPDGGADASAAKIGEREVWMPEAGGFTTCPIYDRAKLNPGNRITGPAIIEQMDTTTIVLPDMLVTVEPHRNLILEFLK